MGRFLEEDAPRRRLRLAGPAPRAGVHRGGAGHAGAGRGRHHRDLQRRQRACWCSRCPSATPIGWCSSGPIRPPRAIRARRCRVRSCSDLDERGDAVRRVRRHLGDDGGAHRRERSGAAAHRPRDERLLLAAGRRGGARPHVPRRGRRRPTRRRAILLSGAVWQRRYGGDPGIVGRRIDVNGQPTIVVGVMPAGFRLMMPPDAAVPDDLEAWLPLNRRFGRGSARAALPARHRPDAPGRRRRRRRGRRGAGRRGRSRRRTPSTARRAASSRRCRCSSTPSATCGGRCGARRPVWPSCC